MGLSDHGISRLQRRKSRYWTAYIRTSTCRRNPGGGRSMTLPWHAEAMPRLTR